MLGVALEGVRSVGCSLVVVAAGMVDVDRRTGLDRLVGRSCMVAAFGGLVVGRSLFAEAAFLGTAGSRSGRYRLVGCSCNLLAGCISPSAASFVAVVALACFDQAVRLEFHRLSFEV